MLKKIYNFFFDFQDYLVFMILLIISLSILLSNENPDIRIFQGDITSVFKFIHYPSKWINTLSGLVDENKNLAEENFQLKILNSEMKSLWQENQRLNTMLGFMDSSYFNLVPGKILNMGTTPIYNSILIDVGKISGVSSYNTVLTADGVVGKTISVGKSTSTVQLINDINFRIGVRFQNSRTLGLLRPLPNDMAEIVEIPKTINVIKGEQIFTSGLSDVFPANIPVGEVVEIINLPNSMYKNIIVKPFVKVNSIEKVFVIISD